MQEVTGGWLATSQRGGGGSNRVLQTFYSYFLWSLPRGMVLGVQQMQE